MKSKTTLLLLWIIFNIILPPPVQSLYSTQYFESELDCIDQVITSPVVFYTILSSYSEETCDSDKSIDIEEIFKIAKILEKNPENLRNSLKGLNLKIKQNLTRKKIYKHKIENEVFKIDNTGYEEVQKNNRKHLDSGRSKIKKIENKMKIAIKMSVEKKIEENEKKLSIEKLSGDILNNDTKTFQTVSNQKTKMMDPVKQKKIIQDTLGKPENQKFGNEQRTQGDEAGDLLFQNTWEYKPFEIQNFEFDLKNLEDVKVGEYKWDMPKKNLENSHKIIQRKNYIGKVNVVNEQKKNENT